MPPRMVFFVFETLRLNTGKEVVAHAGGSLSTPLAYACTPPVSALRKV